MSLVKKLRKIILPLALTGSFFSSGCDGYQSLVPYPEIEFIDAFPSERIESMENQLFGKKFALALITNHDYNDATEGMEEMFHEDFSDLSDYVLYTARTGTFDDFFNNLRDFSTVQPIDALILAYHGDKNGLRMNFEEKIKSSNVQELFEGYASLFSEDAIIILYSCSTGKGENSFAVNLSNAVDRDVSAPKFTLIPETDLNYNDRVGEFALDENGRVSFDYENFRVYNKLKFKGLTYRLPLATYSHELVKGEMAYGENGRDYFLTVDN